MIPNHIVTEPLTPAALSTCFAIPVGHRMRGVLTRLCVVQTAGSLDGFTYALYCAAAACPPGGNPTLSADAPCYNVVPTVTVPSGSATYAGTWPADGVNHLWQPFSTQKDQRGGSLVLQQQLYLLITAATSYAGKTFAAALVVDDANYT